MNKKIIIGTGIGVCAAALVTGAFFMFKKPTVKQLVASNITLAQRLEDGKITSASTDVSAKLGINLKELKDMYDDTNIAINVSGSGTIDGVDAHIKFNTKAKALGEKESANLESYITKDKLYLKKDNKWYVSDIDKNYTLQDLASNTKDKLEDSSEIKDEDGILEDADVKDAIKEIQDKVDSGDYTLEKVDNQWVLTMKGSLKDGITKNTKKLFKSYGLDNKTVNGNFTAILKFNSRTKYIEGIEFSFDKDARNTIGDIASSAAGTKVSVTDATFSIKFKWNEAKGTTVPKDIVNKAKKGTPDDVISDIFGPFAGAFNY